MPQKHQVKRLEELALQSVGDWVKMVGRGLTEPVYLVTQRDPYQGQLVLQQSLDYVRETLYASVPWYFYEQMANIVLTAVKELVEETKSEYNNFMSMSVFMGRMKVSVQMTEVVMHPQMKKITVSAWPKIMRHVMYQNLSKLVGLEELDLGSGSAGWDTTEVEKYILSGVQWMSNLRTFCLCFDCTNSIINVLGTNCPLLQKIDVTSSKSVTDRCLPVLLNCKELREVQFFRTSVSAVGYKSLLTDLPKIQNIGRCDEFGKVLEMLHEEHAKPLPVLSLQCRDVTTEQLKLLVQYCPDVKGISIFHDERIADLPILSALNLQDLKILNCDFYSDRVRQLLEQKGGELLSLHLEHVEEIDLNAIIIISQSCPKLKTLVLFNCEFMQHNLLYFNLKDLLVPPFACLESLICVSDCDLNHLEFLLTHCKQIKSIQLGSSTGINDALVSRVFQRNQMRCLEELKILYSHDLSSATLSLLMTNCDNLRRLAELESWQGLTADQLADFRKFIRWHNIKLDTRPTLSR